MAAEVAAGLWAAEEVVSTTAQAGVAAYMISKPTMPLKATFNQIATSSDDSTKLSLSRSNHTLSVIYQKAYIFGGETAAGKLAGTEVHAITLETSDKAEPDYSVIPAVPDVEGADVPAARSKHAAAAFNICVAIFGGVDEAGEVIDESSIVWLFVTAKSAWEKLEPSASEAGPVPRHSARLFDCQNNLILYGGCDASGAALKDVWRFDYAAKTWTELPQAPVSTKNAVVSDGVLHLIAGSDNMSGDLHILPLLAKIDEGWTTIQFPTNPLTPGPQPREGAGILPMTTGFGRQYLLYFFGARGTASTTTQQDPEAKDAEPQYWSDMWTYQLPSSTPEAKLTTSLTDAIKPAKIKDMIRNKLGYDDGKHSWAEVEVLPPTDLEATEGKVHPGPRGEFAFDVMEDGKSVVIWGGLNPKGEREGDGWIIKLE